MSSTPYKRSRNHRSPDMAAWMAESSGSNSEQMAFLRRKLRAACRQELTKRQREVVELYFFSGERPTITQVADQLGIDRSSVSRTLKRAMRRLQEHLRYAW